MPYFKPNSSFKMRSPLLDKAKKKKTITSKSPVSTSKENRDKGLQGYEVVYSDGTTARVLLPQ